MIIYLLRVLTEYMSIALCLHKIIDKKVKICAESLAYLCIYILILFISTYGKWTDILLYGFWFVYARVRITNKLKNALKVFCIMMVTIPTMQMILYGIFVGIAKNHIKGIDDVRVIEIFLNITITILILQWKRQYIVGLGAKLKNLNKFAIFFIISMMGVYALYAYRNNKILTSQWTDPIIICLVVWGLTIVLLENAEIEKKHKAEELQLYEQYTNAFKDALTVIKMKQHEFDNHINAIRCMQYVIDNKEELIKEQQEYCENIIKENMFNKVLLLKVSPILAGYLYSKFTIAGGKGIQVEYFIQELVDEDKIPMNDLIEVIGILFDNAMEALDDKDNKSMKVGIYYDDKERLIVDVSNESDKISNIEIEKFFKEGYSTKGENRGIGLYRLYNLKKKYKADIYVDNIEINESNYLRFRIAFSKKKKGSH